ncbi:unnamed protein product [Heterobilharzia americana]|nr:unnamed protein product [Heterobilharzia americana]
MDLSISDLNEPSGDMILINSKKNIISSADDVSAGDVNSDLCTYTAEVKHNESIEVPYSADKQIRQRTTKVADTSEMYLDEDAHKHKLIDHNQYVSSTAVYPDCSYYRLYFILALILRLVLVVFSVWQDSVRWPDGQLRFTDVDYDVFSDAAQAFIDGKNIYVERYWLFSKGKKSLTSTQVVSNNSDFFDIPIDESQRHQSIPDVSVIAHIWGKLIFIMADLLCGYLQYKIIQDKLFQDNATLPDKINPRTGQKSLSSNTNRLAVYFVCFGWLFNPVTAVVSARGNADALQSCFVLACLWCILKHRIILAGLLYGLCIHLRIYPVIYSPSIYMWLMEEKKSDNDNEMSKSQSRSLFSVFMKLPNRNHLVFGFSCLLSLIILTGLCYLYFGGILFLQQAYIYHFSRSDFKHNFAPHFLSVYLLSGQKWFNNKQIMPAYGFSQWLNIMWRILQCDDEDDRNSLIGNMNTINLSEYIFNIASLAPCILLIPCLSFKLYSNMGLCWFVLTYMFVTFNRVCTSQYFLWSLCLLPVALIDIRLPPGITPFYAVVHTLLIWFGSQGLWLASAYTLEMCTLKGVFLNRIIWIIVWMASLNFFACNIFILFRLISWRSQPITIIHKIVTFHNSDSSTSNVSSTTVLDNTSISHQKFIISDKKNC